MLCNSFGIKPVLTKSISDVPSVFWVYPDINSLYELGIVTGDADGVIVELAEQDGGWGRRTHMATNRVDSDGNMDFVIYNNYLSDFIPGKYFCILELLEATVMNPSTASMKMNLRGDWEQISLTSVPAGQLAVSNIRFENQHLCWDAPNNAQGLDLQYRVLLSDGTGKWFNHMGTNRTNVAAFMGPAGTYSQIRIDTYVDGVCNSSVTASLTWTVVQDPDPPAPASVVFAPDGNRYQMTVTGLTPNTPYIFHLVNKASDWNEGTFSDGVSDGNGNLTLRFGGGRVQDLLENGYYIVNEMTSNSITSNGKVCETHFAYRGAPVKCNVSGI